MPTTERPGVYSSYEVTSSLAGSGRGGVVGLAAESGSGTAAELYRIDSYADAVESFGEDCNLTELVRLLFLNGAASVRAVPAKVGSAPDTADYTAAFETLLGDRDVSIMLCDSSAAAVHAAMKAAIAGASENYKYRIGIVEGAGTVAELTDAAEAINSERMAMVAPGALTEAGSAAVTGSVAAAVAGVVAASSDPAVPINGAVLYGLAGLASEYSDGNINTLVQGGVCPVESVAGEISAVRGVTTRTTTGGAADGTWHELSTIRIVDEIIPEIRDGLRARFARCKNTSQTRGAIRTQVIIALEEKQKKEIIDSYDSVYAAPSATDPTVCEVSFRFTVAHGLNQICLTAHITV